MSLPTSIVAPAAKQPFKSESPERMRPGSPSLGGVLSKFTLQADGIVNGLREYLDRETSASRPISPACDVERKIALLDKTKFDLVLNHVVKMLKTNNRSLAEQITAAEGITDLMCSNLIRSRVADALAKTAK